LTPLAVVEVAYVPLRAQMPMIAGGEDSLATARALAVALWAIESSEYSVKDPP
jgi:hypothetical protein